VILSVRSFAPALAAGCSVVLKLPAGVFNGFTESGSEGARLLVADPDTNVISYTGSTVVGRQIVVGAAEHLKGLSLELGGKTPMIVFDHADLDAAVPVLTKAVTMFSGQCCMTGSRILAQRSVADKALKNSRGALIRARPPPPHEGAPHTTTARGCAPGASPLPAVRAGGRWRTAWSATC
jgi:acyl-CoA reductase-like NAD-dependent aldehyde dehydrogenase